MNTTRSALTDDTVGMYLREIAKVPLLAPYQEVWLSIQQETVLRIEALRDRLHEQEGRPPTANETLDAVLNSLRAGWSEVSQSCRRLNISTTFWINQGGRNHNGVRKMRIGQRFSLNASITG